MPLLRTVPCACQSRANAHVMGASRAYVCLRWRHVEGTLCASVRGESGRVARGSYNQKYCPRGRLPWCRQRLVYDPSEHRCLHLGRTAHMRHTPDDDRVAVDRSREQLECRWHESWTAGSGLVGVDD